MSLQGDVHDITALLLHITRRQLNRIEKTAHPREEEGEEMRDGSGEGMVCMKKL